MIVSDCLKLLHGTVQNTTEKTSWLNSDLGEVPALDEVACQVPGSSAVNSSREVTPGHAGDLSTVNVI